MGFNAYEDTEAQPARKRSDSVNKSERTEEAEEIFHQHAQGDVLFPGTSFNNACISLANAYPREVLCALKVPQMQGRAWEVFDKNHDGAVVLDEFIDGIAELLNPTTPQSQKLVERMAQGISTPVGSVDYTSVKRVAIIGGGVAGLQVARQLSQIGKQCVIFEKSNDVGGVWRENYADFGLQVPKELYEFPGFPWPTDTKVDKFPPGPQVQAYIQRYAKNFGLYEMCKLETAVLALDAGKEEGWSVKYQMKGQPVTTENFDFIVMCTGMYGWPAHIPVARGNKKFTGEILHSSTFTDRKQAAGKKVVVVGGGKSAVDNAVAAAKEGVSCTLVTRELHWPVPRYLLHLVPFKYGTYSRFGHFMLPTHHEEGNCFWWFHSTCAPVKRVWWKIVETMFKVQFRLPSELTPKTRMDHDLFNGGQILTYECRDMIKAGKIKHIVGSLDHFEEKSVVLTDGQEIETDVVIYGTGFKKSYNLFDSSFIQPQLNIQKDGLYLYRNILPPRVANLAFVGQEVSTFNNILTHGLQALWLKKLMEGVVTLPRPGAMEQLIDKEKAWKQSWMPPSSARASIWQLHMVKYHDNLCKDMGERYKRKCSPCCEAFMPYSAADYTSLFK